ncbi:hypothetical protein C1E23_03970 [Pseudoalteromonas phenolica]|uniref:YaeQ family protein n=1 Tax=Pseudoalteromonas phenolica TaxID=161398 RepID=A0A4Q7ISB9_9GAMM|nr:YaeQ family protein [Pseudoalteromonas phenolica]RZQ54456.1 hypothetical protein C1E23_03970 [Pseudoalteromonas phenolica]
MSKPFVFKARLRVADLFHHANHLEVFTTAINKRESVEHFLLRMIGYCALSFNKRTFLNQKNEKQLPDVWCEDGNSHITLALYVSEIELDEISRLTKLFDKLVILLTDGENWFNEIAHQLVQFTNLSIFSVSREFIEQLETNLTNSIHWDILIERNSISISNKEGYYQTEVKQLY